MPFRDDVYNLNVSIQIRELRCNEDLSEDEKAVLHDILVKCRQANPLALQTIMQKVFRMPLAEIPVPQAENANEVSVVETAHRPKRQRTRRPVLSKKTFRQIVSTSGKQVLEQFTADPIQAISKLSQQLTDLAVPSSQVDVNFEDVDESLNETLKEVIKLEKLEQKETSQCKLNIAAYRLCLMVEFLSYESHEDDIAAQKQYKSDLYAKIKEKLKNRGVKQTDKLVVYGARTKYAVDNIGAYCLLLPAVLPPKFFRESSEEDLVEVKKVFEQKFNYLNFIEFVHTDNFTTMTIRTDEPNGINDEDAVGPEEVYDEE